MDELDVALPLLAIASAAVAGWAWGTGHKHVGALAAFAAGGFWYWAMMHRACPACRGKWSEWKRRLALKWIE
jgi:hypothetical protein